MKEYLLRGQAGSQVSGWSPAAANISPQNSFNTPYGLSLRYTLSAAPIAISSSSVVNGTVTVTTTNPHGLTAGQIINVFGAGPCNQSSAQIQTVGSSTTLTYYLLGGAAWTGSYNFTSTAQSGGYITVAPWPANTTPAGFPTTITNYPIWVYAVVVGPGGPGGVGANAGGGGAGAIAAGWTYMYSSFWLGTGDYSLNSYSRFGHIIAGSGAQGSNGTSAAATTPGLGGGGGGGGSSYAASAGATNYNGIPGGAAGNLSAGGVGAAGGGGAIDSGGTIGLAGGSGTSGGGGGGGSASGGNGGSGLIGGGGGSGATGGNGGAGVLLTAPSLLQLSGSLGASNAGGGGSGVLQYGSAATAGVGGTGGLGGGGGGAGSTTAGQGGAGVIFLYF